MHRADGRVSNFIIHVLAGEPITLFGDGNQTRSFCFVSDLIDGLVRAMESPPCFTGPVNLGNPVEFTMRELAELILKETESTSKLVNLALPQDDPRQRRPDISLAKAKLGWEPQIKLADGLKPTVNYFRQDDLQVWKDGVVRQNGHTTVAAPQGPTILCEFVGTADDASGVGLRVRCL